MYRTTFDLNQHQPIFDDVHTLLRKCGSPELFESLIEFLQGAAGVDHLSLFIFDKRLVPHLIAARSAGRINLAKRAGKEYERSFSYRQDPNTTQVRSGGGGAGGPLLLRLRAQDITDKAYRERIYRQFNLVDRLSIIEYLNERWVVTNLYRDIGAGEFDETSVENVRLISSFIMALLEKHFASLPPSVWRSTTRPNVGMLESIITSIENSLSKREVQVCARAVLGTTNTGIGLALGIQTSTVATLRKRAYTKLHITGISELFALCLGKAIV